MHHRELARDRSQMCYRCQIHDLLHVVGTEHHKTGLPASHHIGVIAKDGKGMCCQCSRRHMKYRRCLFTGQFIHIGDHQKQTLGCRKCRRIGTCRDRTMNRTCRTAFRFHLYDTHLSTEDILPVGCAPFVHIFRHRRRRSDRIDRGHFGKGIGHMRRCHIPVHRL